MEEGMSFDVILWVASVVTAMIVAICERINPAHELWNKARGDVGTDAIHAVVSIGLVPKLMELLLSVTALRLAVFASESFGANLWPQSWGIIPQLLLAMVISQFGEYWAHRSLHEVPLLWRLHATHHSPRRLYWLNAARFHPIDAACLYLIAIAPLILLGASKEILLLVSVWVSVHGLFQHCNIHLRLGWLNYIFSMAELHRWHHSLVLEEANSNYGNNIIFWDLVFRTFHHPKDRDASSEIGLSDLEAFPTDYVGQTLSPFRWSRIRAGSETAE